MKLTVLPTLHDTSPPISVLFTASQSSNIHINTYKQYQAVKYNDITVSGDDFLQCLYSVLVV